MAEGRRPRRNCANKRTAAPSAVHYVGYVEDDETPEMIMKKFEELEKVKAAAQARPATQEVEQEEANPPAEEGEEPDNSKELVAEEGHVAGLTDEQLLEVFKQTSIFNVRSALAGNDSLMDGEIMDEGFDRWSDEEEDGEGLWNDVRGFWSDEDDIDHKNHWRKGGQARAKKEGRVRGFAHSKPRHDIVTSYNATTQALIRKKVRVLDRDALVQIKVPFPLPLSWGRTVKPYVPPYLRNQNAERDENVDQNAAEPPATTLKQESILHTDWNNLRKDYQAVLINPGWEVANSPEQTPSKNFAKLPIPRLCPIGFVFIWIEKQDIGSIFQQMSKWGYVYVENLTWVYLHRNNSIMRLPSEYVQRSHLTLFIFRKEGQGKDIELRHQRKPDVVFDTVRSSPGQAFGVPEEVLVTIETMLPSGLGKFLELWSSHDRKRPGWTQVSEKEKEK